ncbi:hypothetical protein FRC12_003771 [Ceratobasidium sp. 428]|nr:hypothetical protein FRC12_003771 [Ceratobasidium sp. 428]
MSQSPLPPSTPASGVNVENVQVLAYLKKKEEFVFFVIENDAQFKAVLPRLKIASTADVLHSHQAISDARRENPESLIPLPLLNIAFSQQGLNALGVTDDIGDAAFSKGQFADAEGLGDQGTVTDDGFDPHWEPAFRSRIDGVLLAAGESWKTVNQVVKTALDTLQHSVRVVYKLKGAVRPKDQQVGGYMRSYQTLHAYNSCYRAMSILDGNTQCAIWMVCMTNNAPAFREDGISNPAVIGVVDPLPGQRTVPPGTILLGTDQDLVPTRPPWAVEGSFLVFRQLSQLVPEFHDFLDKNPVVSPGLDPQLGSELMGARLVGRWKSGAPIQVSPLADDPELAKDKERNNNFIYPLDKGEEGQTACPYAAHIRKTNPRNDLFSTDVDNTDVSNPVAKLSITRAGIPYGPEVTPSEALESLTEHERGLAFVCYQSALQAEDKDKGFRFIQKSWANNVKFPPKDFPAGFDAIIGQANGQSRGTLGMNSGPQLTLLQDFVVSRGGEYFFSPSISALRTVFAGVTK